MENTVQLSNEHENNNYLLQCDSTLNGFSMKVFFLLLYSVLQNSFSFPLTITSKLYSYYKNKQFKYTYDHIMLSVSVNTILKFLPEVIRQMYKQNILITVAPNTWLNDTFPAPVGSNDILKDSMT